MVDCSDRNNSKYYVVVVQVTFFFFSTDVFKVKTFIMLVYELREIWTLLFWVQYTARFNAEAVKNFLYSLNEGKIAKKKFNC